MAAEPSNPTGLWSAILAVQAEAPALQKSKLNPAFKSKYVSLDVLMETVMPIVNKHGLVWMTFPGVDERGEPALMYRLVHAGSGDSVDGTMSLRLAKSDPQGQGSAITYARRYSLMAVLGLVADEDDDGNKANGRGAKAQPPYGPPLEPVFEKVTKAAVVQIAGDTESGKKLWLGIEKELGGYVPQGVALALIRVAETASVNSVPIVEAPDPDMSTELGQHITIVNPATGEVLALDAPTEDLGRLLADIREHESLLREMKKVASRELLARMDRMASWTLPAGDLKLKGSSPKPAEEFDGGSLRADLLELADEGLLTVEAVDAAVETVVMFKARVAGINALRKLGGRVADVVAAHARPVEKERYVTVSRA